MYIVFLMMNEDLPMFSLLFFLDCDRYFVFVFNISSFEDFMYIISIVWNNGLCLNQRVDLIREVL